MKKSVHIKQEATPAKTPPKNGVDLMPPAYGISFVDNKPIQKKENNIGLPDQLKSGVESLSGIDMSDVKVHYNSSQPAQLNAHAYAQGNQIHIASGQEKHLPHEAWHVVQQKQGRVKPTKQMKGKVNVNDDVGLEKEADVMGEKSIRSSTHALQFRFTHQKKNRLKNDFNSNITNESNNSVAQRITKKELELRGHIIRASRGVPKKGVNLWRMENTALNSLIYVLGTSHGLRLSDMGSDASARRYIINFLQTEHFTHIYTELPANLPHVVFVDNLAQNLEEKVSAKQAVKNLAPTAARINRLRAEQRLTNSDANLGGFDMHLDDAYLALASTRKPQHQNPNLKIGALESPQSRLMARQINIQDMNLQAHDPTFRLIKRHDEPITPNDGFIRGDQQELFLEASEEMMSGRDTASSEERNKQWMERVNAKKGDRQLWIVGAAHIPGLVLRFHMLGWRPHHMDLPNVKE
jgi:hypothetical protein